MAGSPEFKVYTVAGEYVAACKHVEDAAAIVAAYGSGATIRRGHSIRQTIWIEGVCGNAGDSYDEPANHEDHHGPACQLAATV